MSRALVKKQAEVAVDRTPLNSTERERLARYEAVIGKGRKTFREIGTALVGVCEERLYREKYPTFRDYLRERWDLGLRYAEYQIGASQVVGHLEANNCSPVPATESQARPLTELRKEENGKSVIDMELVEGVWREVVEKAPKDDAGNPRITAKLVKEKVKAKLEPAEEPAGSQTMKESNAKLEALARAITAHVEEANNLNERHLTSVVPRIQTLLVSAARVVRGAKGRRHCDHCGGTGCLLCNQTGWLTGGSSRKVK